MPLRARPSQHKKTRYIYQPYDENVLLLSFFRIRNWCLNSFVWCRNAFEYVRSTVRWNICQVPAEQPPFRPPLFYRPPCVRTRNWFMHIFKLNGHNLVLAYTAHAQGSTSTIFHTPFHVLNREWIICYRNFDESKNQLKYFLKPQNTTRTPFSIMLLHSPHSSSIGKWLIVVGIVVNLLIIISEYKVYSRSRHDCCAGRAQQRCREK